MGAASKDVDQSSARNVVPDDYPLGPDYRGREVNFRRRLVLLLKRQGPGVPRRIPPAQAVVNHVGHYFDRRRVLHSAAVLAAVVTGQVGAVPKPLTKYLQVRSPVFRLDFKGQTRWGSSKRERPLGHVLARWLLLFGIRRQLWNHVGMGIASANFGLLIVPQHTISRCSRERECRPCYRQLR